MAEIIQGEWDDPVARHDPHDRTVCIIVLDRDQNNPWLKMLRARADSHQPLGHSIDDSRESIYSGTADDPR